MYTRILGIRVFGSFHLSMFICQAHITYLTFLGVHPTVTNSIRNLNVKSNERYSKLYVVEKNSEPGDTSSGPFSTLDCIVTLIIYGQQQNPHLSDLLLHLE